MATALLTQNMPTLDIIIWLSNQKCLYETETIILNRKKDIWRHTKEGKTNSFVKKDLGNYQAQNTPDEPRYSLRT